MTDRRFQAIGCAAMLAATLAVLWLAAVVIGEVQARTIVAAPRVEPAAIATVEKSGGPSDIPASFGAISLVLSGRATWYCGNGSPCTSGTDPGDLVAAIDPTTGIRKGERVTVRHDGRAVTVRIVDVCACGGSRVIDLTTGAFRRLAPLSRGVIPVELEVGGRPEPTLPPTDTE